MTRLTVDTSGAGALLHGTDRPDAQAIKDLHDGWKWSRNLGAWYLPRSLRPETVDLKVRRLVDAFPGEVTVEGGDRETDEERRARRLERDRELVGVHEQRAGRAQAEGDAHFEKFKQIGDMIPSGQPVLLGHHSQRRHQRDLGRMDTELGKSVEGWNERDRQERLAASAAHRVERAERRDEPLEFSSENVNVGDRIHHTWGEALVLRVSAKSVTIASTMVGLPYTDTLPYRRIEAVVALATDESRTQVRADLAKVAEHRQKYKR